MVVFVIDTVVVEGRPSVFVVVGVVFVFDDRVGFGELGASPVLVPGDC